MIKKAALIAVLITASFFARAQDFKIVDYTKGYDQPHPADKTLKINVMKKAIPLTVLDMNKDGIMDTILYKLSSSGGQIATIQVYDPKEDDWMMLYRMDLKNYGGEDGVWFYQLTTADNGNPLLLVYTGRKDHKFLTVIKYDMTAKKYVTKDYDLNNKNLFPHMYVVNKKKIRNHNGSNSGEKDAYNEIPAE